MTHTPETTPALSINTPGMTPSWNFVPISLNWAKANYINIIYLFFIPALLSIVGMLFVVPTYDNNHIAFGRFAILGAALLLTGVVWAIVSVGPAKLFQTKTAQGKTLTVQECYKQGLKYNWRMYGFNILFSLLVFFGFLAFIVPGLIFLRRYYLSPYYIVDEHMGIIEAMKRSSRESLRYKGYVWGIIGVIVVFNMGASAVGNIPLVGTFLGQIFTYVVLFLPAQRYFEVKTAFAKANKTVKQK